MIWQDLLFDCTPERSLLAQAERVNEDEAVGC